MWQGAERTPRPAFLPVGAIAGIATLMLAACAADPNAPPGASSMGSYAGRATEDAVPIGAVWAAPGANAGPARAAPVQPAESVPATTAVRDQKLVTAALPNASRAPAAAPSALVPARLKGYTAGELKAALGDPTLLRRDGPAQLWQYAGSGCVLHVFLYDDHGTFRVTYSEVRIDDPDVANPPTCVEGKDRSRASSETEPAARPALPSPTSVTPVAARSRGGV